MNIATTKVSTRLMLGFGLVITLLVVIAASAVYQLMVLSQDIEKITDDRYPKTVWANEIADNVNVIARAMRNTLLLQDKPSIDKELERIASARLVITARFEKLEATIKSAAGKKVLGQAKQARADYVLTQEKFLQMVRADHPAEATQYLLTEVRKTQGVYFDAINVVIELQGKQMDEAGKEAAEQVRGARAMLLALTGLAIAIAAGAAWFITRSLTRALGGEPSYAAEVVRRIADGDLATEVQVSVGDRDSLLAAMKAMRASLAHVVSQVRNSSDSIATGSAQIATGNADLSQRTEEQAANLQQTAASMEQMNATVRQNAETAQAATQLAGSASGAESKGGEMVGRVVTTMNEINSSSKRIADIIGVIDGIAFQTNILALNAAVEAARAGEQGRGFAVVASEVRSLVQRSAGAAKEIKSLIGESVDKVEAGSKLVGDTGAAMDDIVVQVKRVAQMIGEISNATQEQMQGIGQVSDAVGQLDQVTQQNAALVEESAAAADSLKQQAAGLAQVVSVFKLN